MTVKVSDVIKGTPTLQAPDTIAVEVGVGDAPIGTVADIDHLLLLSVLTGDDRVYYPTAGFMSVFANVDGRVVAPEYDAIKRVYHNSIFTTALDGTSSRVWFNTCATARRSTFQSNVSWPRAVISLVSAATCAHRYGDLCHRMSGTHIFRVVPSSNAFRERVAGRFARAFPTAIGEPAAAQAFRDRDPICIDADADVGS